MKAVGEPERIKRPWLSIIKNLVQPKYSIENKEGQFKINEKWIKSPMNNLVYLCYSFILHV
jgi:hypothetical protein